MNASRALQRVPHPAELDVLLEYLALSARELIELHGEAYPIAAVVDRALGIAAFDVHDDDDTPDPLERRTVLIDAMRDDALAGNFVAAGVCIEVNLDGGQSGVAIDVEHVSGAAFRVVVPYSRVDKRIALETASASVRAPEIFPAI